MNEEKQKGADIINLNEVRLKREKQQEGTGLYFPTTENQLDITLDHAILEAGVIKSFFGKEDNLYKDFIRRREEAGTLGQLQESELRQEMELELERQRSRAKVLTTRDLIMVVDEHLKNGRKMHGTYILSVAEELLSRQ